MENRKRKFIPLNDYLLVKKADVNEEVKQNEFIVDVVTTETTIPEGIVLEENATIEFVKNGDRVVFNPHNSVGFLYNGQDCVITRYENIFGKIEWVQ